MRAGGKFTKISGCMVLEARFEPLGLFIVGGGGGVEGDAGFMIIITLK